MIQSKIQCERAVLCLNSYLPISSQIAVEPSSMSNMLVLSRFFALLTSCSVTAVHSRILKRNYKISISSTDLQNQGPRRGSNAPTTLAVNKSYRYRFSMTLTFIYFFHCKSLKEILWQCLSIIRNDMVKKLEIKK